MRTGKIEANLANLNQEFNLSYIVDLIKQKQAESEKTTLKKVDLEFYYQEYQRLQCELETAFNNSHLPENPSAKPELNSLLVEIRQTR